MSHGGRNKRLILRVCGLGLPHGDARGETLGFGICEAVSL